MMWWSVRVLTACALLGLVCAPAHGQEEVGELFATDASVRGSVMLAAGGMQVISGSSVVAGTDTALLRLRRGGEVRFCPRTTVSLASTQSGRNLMLGMNSGSLEIQYDLADSQDALLTPDFRILLQGPGSFRFAVGATSEGNTCIRSLPGNSSALKLTELMGDGNYTVKPGEQVLFRGGRLNDRQEATPSDCGCPAPPPVLRVENSAPPAPLLAQDGPPGPLPYLPAPVPLPPAFLSEQDMQRLLARERIPEPPPVPAAEVQVQIDAPFIFRADEPEPSPVELISQLRLAPAPRFRQEVLGPPPAPVYAAPRPAQPGGEQQRRRGLFRRVGAFLASIFR
jgi:hypothetical protein